LMIDVMTLRQFYERREITEMIWIHDISNSANSMIKFKSLTALKTMIDINQINLNITEWVKRATARETVNQDKKTKQRDEWDEKIQKDKYFQFSKEVRVLVRIKIRRYVATPRVASLTTWFTLGEHYI
jgi:wyosine [tRNA(Phe)-imidazoG37] synthetase (radical SAM superfamily)